MNGTLLRLCQLAFIAISLGLGTFAGADSAPIDQLEITAHRGNSGRTAANSMRAIRTALAGGIKSLQVDVIMTGDKELILHRDYVIYPDEYSGTPVFFNIGRVPLERIRPLRSLKDNSPILTLEEFFKTLVSDPDFANVSVRLELGLQDRSLRSQLATQVLAAIERYELENRVMAFSFDWPLIAELKRQNPHVQRGLLMGKAHRSSFWRYNLQSAHSLLETYGPSEISPHWELVDATMLKTWAALGVKVRPYEVNSDSEAMKLKQMGVTGIVSNYPVPMKQILAPRCAGLLTSALSKAAERPN